MESLGLYIHIPFCKSKCYYCDFNSYSHKEELQYEYIDCLIKEINLRFSDVQDKKIESIYIGGGTPTYLTLSAFEKLLKYMEKYLKDDIEYTCEANPGTLTCDKISMMKHYGINRLSIGLQSSNDDILKKIGRIHCFDDFINNYNLARKIGYNNINVDLMFSIQGQTINDFNRTLDNILALSPEHISCYSLIIEEGTAFYEDLLSGRLSEIDDEVDRGMYHLAYEKLSKSGYKRYEISNYAREGFECRHNIMYWKTRDYLGIGAGAHSYINGSRFSNERLPEYYIRKVNKSEVPNCWVEKLTKSDMMSEFMFMGLRMDEGICLKEFEGRFGVSMMSVYGTKIHMLNKKGLTVIEDGRFIMTQLGFDLANQVFVEFV